MSETNGTTALAVVPAAQTMTAPADVNYEEYFSRGQIDTIRNAIAKGANDDDFKMFLYQCARTRLDPFSRQIYCLQRKERVEGEWVNKSTIMTGIDGLRLIAERTNRYAPGPETTFEYDAAGMVRKATAYVLKLVAGTWHTVAASAHYSEYVGTYKDRDNGRQVPTKMWAEKPHIMLGKCAEALALRKAFPAEMSGLYSAEEMSKAVEQPAEYTPPKAFLKPPERMEEEDANRAAAKAVERAGKTGDTGEAPTDADLDKLEARVFDDLKWPKPRAANWLRKHFSTDNPGGLTRVQVATAMLLLDAAEKAVKDGNDDAYEAVVTDLRKQGLIAPAKEGA